MTQLNEHSIRAMGIAREILGPCIRSGEPDLGEVMMMLETVNSVTLLAVCGQDQRKAQGMLDALQDGISRRMMMNDGKPYDGR